MFHAAEGRSKEMNHPAYLEALRSGRSTARGTEGTARG